MAENTSRASSSGGPDVVVGILLAVAAVVFHTRYDGSLTFTDDLGNVTDLQPAVEFLIWTLVLAVLARGLLKVFWAQIAAYFAREHR